MDTNTQDRSLGGGLEPRAKGPLPARRSTEAARAHDQEAVRSEPAQMPERLLRDAARAAGSFQRSVLGHLDHQDWRSRVNADGQRLMDVLAEMGFCPDAAKPAP